MVDFGCKFSHLIPQDYRLTNARFGIVLSLLGLDDHGLLTYATVMCCLQV